MGGCLGSPGLFYNVHVDEEQFDVFTLINWKSTYFSVPQLRRTLKVCMLTVDCLRLVTDITFATLQFMKLFWRRQNSCPGFACALFLKMLVLLVNEGESDSASILCRDKEELYMCIGNWHSFWVVVSISLICNKNEE